MTDQQKLKDTALALTECVRAIRDVLNNASIDSYASNRLSMPLLDYGVTAALAIDISKGE